MTVTDKRKRRGDLPELLAPAGSPEALAAAIEAGADAVYLGLSVFSNRMRARNFSPEELSDAVTLCRTYGVKCYVALNTRVFDREREELEAICSLDGVRRADGIIVADPGLAAMLRERVPHVPLHASTQMTCSTARDAAVLGRMGFTRMVAPRELTGGQIKELAASSPLDIEIFIHGAHCVSFSGQCLMSYAMGGRSPNRGECAQPCRMAYSIEGKNGAIAADPTRHPLSLKDMSLASHIPEIIESGVASLKIEGRQKGADYVRGVTATYRRLLDEGRAATAEETSFLEGLFSRSGFTDGYFTGDRGRMTGVRPEGEGDRTAPRRDAAIPDRKVRITAKASIKTGVPSILTVSDGEITVTVAGAVPDGAKTLPLGADGVRSCLVRTGSTPFLLDPGDIEVDLDPSLWLTKAQLNELRRAGTDALTASHAASASTRSAPAREREKVKRPAEAKIAVLLRGEQATEEAARYFDILYLPEDALFGLPNGAAVPSEKLGLYLPPVTVSDAETERALDRAKAAGIKYVSANTLSQLDLARSAGFDVTATQRFNVTSTAAAGELFFLGADRVTASVELSAAALSRLGCPVGAVVYGRFPLMTTERCILTDVCSDRRGGKRCSMRELSPVRLVDRKGARMPALPIPGCRTLIFNANPVWCADRRETLEKARLTHSVFLFTAESPREVDRVIAAYENGDPPDDPGAIRRL
ncbi:MAG: U32 family peptidase [Clostridia bacterium]|nr:U32 family peptidase [Clostridia bacterium]